MTVFFRLPLEKAYNVRELGGYPVKNGAVTAFRQFLRSDNLTNVTNEDINVLLDYGVSAVLDLRSELEAERAPNPLTDHASVQYLHKPLLVVDSDMLTSIDTLEEVLSERENILSDMYIYILERSKTELKEIFTWIAEQDGCVLFHCTAGKDRTGVLAMLLLGLAGVAKRDIIANYAVTQIYNQANPNERMMNLPFELPDNLLESHPSFIAKAYQHLIDHYGNIEHYLSDIGMSEAGLDRVKRKLIQVK